MDHEFERESEAVVRALLVAATGDGPPEHDLLDTVRRRARRQRVRRRVLVPSLASLTLAAVIAVAALAASVVTGTPSAQARVAAAAGRTATESFRVRMSSGTIGQGSKQPITQVMEGFFDPARHTGWLHAKGLEVRYVGDVVYSQLPAGTTSDGKRWVAVRRSFVMVDQPLPPIAVVKVGFWDPQEALALLRSAFSVHEQGRVSGDGWSGRRYAFDLRDGQQAKDNLGMTGTVDVDQSGRVRRLDVTVLVETASGQRADNFRTVMEFRDYGAHETVSAPPAAEITHALVRGKPEPAKAETKNP
jgi:opacity protein-like surface antigen